MDAANNALFEENAALKAALVAAETVGQEVAARLAVAVAKNSEDAALIAAKNLEIAKLKHQIYGHRSERSARLIEQMALQFVFGRQCDRSRTGGGARCCKDDDSCGLHAQAT